MLLGHSPYSMYIKLAAARTYGGSASKLPRQLLSCLYMYRTRVGYSPWSCKQEQCCRRANPTGCVVNHAAGLASWLYEQLVYNSPVYILMSLVRGCWLRSPSVFLGSYQVKRIAFLCMYVQMNSCSPVDVYGRIYVHMQCVYRHMYMCKHVSVSPNVSVCVFYKT